jgi:hypothetical protein
MLIKGDGAASVDAAPKKGVKDALKHFPADEPRFLIKPWDK